MSNRFREENSPLAPRDILVEKPPPADTVTKGGTKMSHRIGRVIAQSPAVVVGPGHGTEVSPGRWRVTFSPAPASTGTKFLMLHFTSAALGAGDRIEVRLGYDT